MCILYDTVVMRDNGVITAHSTGRLKMYDLKITEWRVTDKFPRNCRVWKMQDWKMAYRAN